MVESMDCEGVSTQLTVADYPKGVYIVKLYTPKGVATKKLVVN
ncbi:MAG: T9SS type A sorting domain-containing protein [Bacteroidales bacterium]|nr:T9SS type A sorting domain-containing protein [Bacteroidales bacterium]